MKQELIKLKQARSISARKGLHQQDLQAQLCQPDEAIEKLIRDDVCYKVLSNIQSSPGYKDTMKRDLFGMIRQLGTPTWFMTLCRNPLARADLCLVSGPPSGDADC